MKYSLALLSIFVLGGCAAGMRAPSSQSERPAEPVQFERILGSFSVKTDIPIYLTPAMLERGFNDDDRVREDNFVGLIQEFQRLKSVRGEAAARLNQGAVLWYLGKPDHAYSQLRDAQLLFVRAADLEGEAHAHEWLGFFFRESGEVELAEEHLALSYQMFTRLENLIAAERVLSYAGD